MAEEKLLDERVKAQLNNIGAWYIKYWGGGGFTKSGIPDILACVNGHFFGIEDKASRGKPTLLQLRNLEKIREAGGFGILLYPHDFSEFVDFLKNPSNDNKWYWNNVYLQREWVLKLNER